MKLFETEIFLLSRRDFLEKTTQSLAAVALGSIPDVAVANVIGPSLRLEQNGADIQCMAGNMSLCSLLPSAVVNLSEAKTQLEIEKRRDFEIDRHFLLSEWDVRDKIEQIVPGLFEWRRSWTNTSAHTLQGDLCLEVESSYSSQFFLVPGASYNGNRMHGRTAPQGLTLDGSPWIFSAYRSTIPA